MGGGTRERAPLARIWLKCPVVCIAETLPTCLADAPLAHNNSGS